LQISRKGGKIPPLFSVLGRTARNGRARRLYKEADMSEDEARKLEQLEPEDEVEGHHRRVAADEPAAEGSDDDDVEAHRRMV
jgi:hypothetical protein